MPRSAELRRERVLASPRYRDGTFHNTHPVTSGLVQGTRWEVTRSFLFGKERRRPPRPLPSGDPRPAWARPADTGLRATWLGHSTVLLELDGVRVVTDPVWSARISPFGVLAPRRFQPAPVAVADLPPLDAILVSHDHYDHLDRPTVEALAAASAAPFVTSLGVGAHLEAWGVPPERIVELDWWERAELGPVAFTAAPSQHFSGRAGGRDRTLWSSFAIETERRRVFFSGDTGLTPEYAEIGARLGPFDLVMLEVGAFHPAWGHIHLGPENALAALELLGGGAFLPVHWGTFNLGLHAWDEPAEKLVELGGAAQLVMPRLGEAVEPARRPAVVPWWREVGTPELAALPAR
ncbi:MAG: MBL fold metallo-hydrolase [Deltaproteobacteria bacterium]|nr:MBL fold metallo-hydrolase [Deltaproteobacteria bacterium]